MTVPMNAASALFLALLRQGQDPAPEKPAPRIGEFQAAFSERHPLGLVDEQIARFQWQRSELKKRDPQEGKYDLANESFQVAVPETFDASKKYGLLVWVSAGLTGHLPADWLPILAERDLLGVGADHSENGRDVWYRIGLALDAVHNMKKLYPVDDDRVYVAGFSGGGRIASRLGVAYADVFRGGLYLGGVDFYRNVPDPTRKDVVFPALFAKPKDALLRKARNDSRHVVLVGDQDFNCISSKAIFEGMTKMERFAHATYLEMPGEGHVCAGADWFGKALDFLDACDKKSAPKK